MKTKQKILTITGIIFSIFSCTPDCKEGGIAPTEDLPKDFKGYLFPYGENQNLRYLKNGKDTILFYNQGYKSGYNYTFTQEDCPKKRPLEFKSLMFHDSLEGHNILLYYFLNQNFYEQYTITIDKRIMFDGHPVEIVHKTPPYISIDINNIHYDTLAYKTNDYGDYLYYKTTHYGLLKFKINNNVFELIP